jgi:hypothetical protein
MKQRKYNSNLICLTLFAHGTVILGFKALKISFRFDLLVL